MRQIIFFSTLLFLMVLGCSKNYKALLITGHRGASGLAPENTIVAMNKAIAAGADFSELDVQETRDGVLVLLHDGSLKRTTSVDKNIWEMDHANLSGIDAGSWFNPQFKDEPIPTLEEVMDFVRGKMKLNIELKYNGNDQHLAKRVVDMIERKNFSSECIVTSFNLKAIDEVRGLNRNIRIGYLFSKIPDDVDVFTADVDLFSVRHTIVDEAFVTKAHAHKKDVHVYTVNDPQEMRRLIGLGVESIITDRPDVLKNVLQSL